MNSNRTRGPQSWSLVMRLVAAGRFHQKYSGLLPFPLIGDGRHHDGGDNRQPVRDVLLRFVLDAGEDLRALWRK